MMQLWVCGQFIEEGVNDDENAWTFQGVFSTEELAIAACKTSDYFITPAQLDEELPSETFAWPGCYYPRESDAS